MFTIRKEQMEVFQKESIESFKDEMVVDVCEVHPEVEQEMSRDDIRDVIQYGIDIAASYGITGKYFVAAYIHLMFDLGIDFDQDPDYPWAEEILNDESLSEKEVMEILVDQAAAEAEAEEIEEPANER